MKKSGLFRYADGVDKFLLLLGSLGSIGDGLTTPLTMLVLSGMINQYSRSNPNTFSNQVVDKVLYFSSSVHFLQWNLLAVACNLSVCLQYTLRLLYIAFGVGICAFFAKNLIAALGCLDVTFKTEGMSCLFVI